MLRRKSDRPTRPSLANERFGEASLVRCGDHHEDLADGFGDCCIGSKIMSINDIVANIDRRLADLDA